MKKRQMERWVKALRSGKFKQGKHKLYDPKTDTYCCLGVLTHINKEHLSTTDFTKVYSGELEALTGSLLVHTGVQDPIGEYVCPEGFEDNLARINDEANKSFAEIADIIEQNYKRL